MVEILYVDEGCKESGQKLGDKNGIVTEAKVKTKSVFALGR